MEMNLGETFLLSPDESQSLTLQEVFYFDVAMNTRYTLENV